ncbi:MAG: hypothetical protein WCI23_01645 [Chlorobiaceae bacterium]
MRFERDILESSLAKLRDQKERYDTLNDAIVEQISQLSLSVGFVKQEEVLIRAAQTKHFWNQTTDESFDELIERLSPLMKFREQESVAIGQVHLNLQDLLHNKEMVEFGPQHEAVGITRYREMHFLNLLKTFIIEREKGEKRDLINAPFTVIHPKGIRGVFSLAEINEILALAERLAA